MGVYGLTACTIAERAPEIGVRLALGAGPWDVREEAAIAMRAEC